MKVELLAPAGNEASLNCAINNGANAVYLGIGDFNARGNIENFSFENLRENVRKAHLFGLRVFLTLNTLVLDEEIDSVLNVVKKALEYRVDAFIVQDIGLAYLLRNKFPGIELHASTQMGIQNLEGAKFLTPLEYKRLVLARETPLNEITRIKDNLNVEIEYFVQGALCVSFSGNCYLCSLLADASGNRGKCKQFCRLPFTMQNRTYKKEGYLLSTRDFCMLPRLKDLVDSGVTSLKIEGRARRPAYVAGAVKIYREAIDNNFNYDQMSIENLKRLFNRGDYISGYFDNEKIIYNKTQNHLGINIGNVLSFKKGKRFNEVTIKSTHKLSKGDALKFFANEKEVASVGVQDVKAIGDDKYIFTTLANIPVDAKVNLIVDSVYESGLLSEKRKIEVRGFFEGIAGQCAKLTLNAEDESVTVESDFILEKAKGQPLSQEECFSQVSKLGDDFVLTQLSCSLENVFIAKSQLNQLRRLAIEKLKEKLIEKNQKKIIEEKEFKLIKSKNKINNKKILYFKSLTELEKYINLNDYLVYNFNCLNTEEITQFCNKYKEKIIYLNSPIIAEEKDIKVLKELYKENSNLGVVANNYYAFCFTSPDKTIVGSEMNVANSFSVCYYKSQGYNKIILTKENFNIENICDFGLELFVETKMRKNLMHFKHCPFKENLGGSCENCKYIDGTKYALKGKSFVIERRRINSCQFVLKEENPETSFNNKFGQVIEAE